MNDLPEELLFIIASQITIIQDLLNYRCSCWRIYKLSIDNLLKNLYLSFLNNMIVDYDSESQSIFNKQILNYIDNYKLVTPRQLSTLSDFIIIAEDNNVFDELILFIPGNTIIADFIQQLKNSSWCNLHGYADCYFIFFDTNSAKVLSLRLSPPALIRYNNCWDLITNIHREYVEGRYELLSLTLAIKDGIPEIYELLKGSFKLIVGAID